MKYPGGARIGLVRRMWRLEGPVALLGAAALIILGPLREAFGGYPLLLFASALSLFMTPGVLLTHWIVGERFGGAAIVPVGFVLSTALFGMLGVPVLMLHLTLGAYMWMGGVIIAGFLITACVKTLRGGAATEEKYGAAGSAPPWELWVPFLLFGGVLAFVSRVKVPGVNEDIWIYLAYVREYLSTEKLALYEPYFGNQTDLSRAQINGWLLIQAALSRASGIDPIELVLEYLGPALVIIALLCFYVLARSLFKSEAAALLAGCLYALFFLVNLDYTFYSFGGEFVGRIAEDKFTARYLFLPIALAFALFFIEERRWRYLGLFGFMCWAVMAVHPVGLAIIGVSVGGFGVVYVALNVRRTEAWKRAGGLAGVLLGVILLPALIVFAATGESLTAVLSDADINSNDPDVLANMVFVRPKWKHVYELGGGSYIMHPWVLLDPVVLGALLLGVPFLVRRLKGSLAAQFLLGMLLLSVFVCYFPPVATFVGDHVILPGQLWRLAWPIPLAAVLVVGWMAWEAVGGVAGLHGSRGPGRILARFAPLALVFVVAMIIAPTTLARVEDMHRTFEQATSDPIFHWMRNNIREPSVVLAPDTVNTRIPAYAAQINVVSLRGGAVLNRLGALERRAPGRIEVPQRTLDLRKFYRDSTPEEKAEILRRYEVDYVMLRARSPLRDYLEGRPGSTVVETPGDSYSLFAVDLGRLGEPGG
jgi:Family of unknown function (DUF6077)